MGKIKATLLVTSCLLCCPLTWAASISTQTIDLPLDTFQLSKSLTLSVGIGSGAFHDPNDPDNIIYTISDRGPNIKCADSGKVIGQKVCEKGKIFPEPGFTPSIYKLKILPDQVEVVEQIKIKNQAHMPVTGIATANTEPAFDLLGEAIDPDPNGVDSEALVRTKHGDFYIADEYGPSILHLASDGTIIERWIPKGSSRRFHGAEYELRENLPAILSKRHLNRGIESIGISPDNRYLYFAMQSPLDNPDKKAYAKSRHVRLFKLDREQAKVVHEYLYQLDTPDTFHKDSAKKQRAQKDVKVSELVAIGNDELILLERISKTTKFYKVTLSDEQALHKKWNNAAQLPTLELTTTVKPLTKTLMLDTDDYPRATSKLEGIAYVNPKLWYLINDNDFGIEGAKTEVLTVKF